MSNEADPAAGEARSAHRASSHDGQRATADVLLDEVIARIRRRYPDAVMAYLNHPGDGDDDRIILWDLAGVDRPLWPDEDGEVFQGRGRAGGASVARRARRRPLRGTR